MTADIICYEGVSLSLGLMVTDYRAKAVRYLNQHGFIQGTRLRPPYLPEHFDSWLDQLAKSKSKDEVFAILLHDDLEEERRYRYVGHMGIHGIRYPESHAETGSVIGDPDAQGRGYGKEAKLLLQKHAFDALHLHKLTSSVKAWNAASLGHLIACGYRICGRYRGQELHEGRRVDAVLLECFRADWEPIWNAYRATGSLPTLTEEQRELVRKEASQKSE